MSQAQHFQHLNVERAWELAPRALPGKFISMMLLILLGPVMVEKKK